MNYLLDTCVLSEYRKPAPSAKVLAWVDEQADDSLYISVLTIGELDKGICKMPPSNRKTNLAAFVDALIARFDRRILDLDTETLRRWGEMIADLESKGRPMPVIDSLMAATALARGMTLVTRNEDDFIPAGIRVLNIWE
ncbi:MAG: type II toxin-antitoxin system VapC family toxin [Pyrinomonadaceae bacterium]|nr:type II toxin-antitoxin system VapC family toxin [Pyrinomonadaceae bacterium]MBP6212320.1 type II toxin-antitoxin system VapC family toxin [Pyrinomonadaceae bacterium]